MTLKTNMLRHLIAAIVVAGLAYSAPAVAQVTVTPTPAFSTTVNWNQTKTYTMVVANGNVAAATNVILSGTLPVNTTVSAISGCVPTTTGSILPCLVSASLAVNGTHTVAVGVTYHTPDPVPTTCPEVGVAGYGPLTFHVNSTGNAEVTAVADPKFQYPQGDVSITIEGPASVSHSGGTYTYPFTVTNRGPCTIPGASVVVDDNVLSSAFTFVSATGICSAITGVYLPDGSDYSYCDTGSMVSGASVTGSITYSMAALPKDLIRSNQNAGMMVIYSSTSGKAYSLTGTWSYWDYNHANDSGGAGDWNNVAVASTGCSSAGGGASFFLLLMGMAAFYLARRRVA